MRIESSTISMSSTTSTVKNKGNSDFSSYFKASWGSADVDSNGITRMKDGASGNFKIASFNSIIKRQDARKLKDTQDEGYIDIDISEIDKRKMQAIQEVIERLTGKKVRLHTVKTVYPDVKKVDFNMFNGKSGFWVRLDNKTSNQSGDIQETEKVHFESNGVITTKDGKKVEFSFQAGRETVIKLAGGAQQTVDPLVVNFDNDMADLKDIKISFDIDGNGKNESISFTSSGSGFLALDLNSDGKINNGRELFGPKTGDGFIELSTYDGDKNDWIDEGDPIFNKLRIWTKDNNGNDILLALGEKGIGAIYLGNINSEFNINNGSNSLLGIIKESGIFVREDGTVGTVQDVDMTV